MLFFEENIHPFDNKFISAQDLIGIEIKLEFMDRYVCNLCGYIYDPAEGDPENGIDPGTPFEELPEDWTCPACGVGKEYFEEYEG